MAIGLKVKKLFAVRGEAGREERWKEGDCVEVRRDGKWVKAKVAGEMEEYYKVAGEWGETWAGKEDVREAKLKIKHWDWKVNGAREVEVPVLADDQKYKLLGVGMRWKKGSKDYGKVVVLRANMAITRMLAKKAEWDECAYYFEDNRGGRNNLCCATGCYHTEVAA